MVNIKMVERAARAIHTYELEHGYISREWGGADDETVYMEMANAALGAAELFRDAHKIAADND